MDIKIKNIRQKLIDINGFWTEDLVQKELIAEINLSYAQNSELLDKVRRMEEENGRLKDISEKAENLISVIYMDQRVQTFWTRDKYPKVFEEYESARRILNPKS